MCVFILSLDNMLLVLPLSPTPTSQFIILISQVFILLVTFSLTHHILWVDIHHLSLLLSMSLLSKLSLLSTILPLDVNQVKYIGLPGILLALLV